MIFRAVEDGDLIRQAARGSVEAFNLLVSRWEKRVYNYLLRLTANREDALDLTQDVFLKAYQNLRKLDDRGAFRPVAVPHRPQRGLFHVPQAKAGERCGGRAAGERRKTGITVGGSSVFPIELSLAVASALDRLSPEQREAVVLKIYQGFKFEEMAEILSCPVSTVKSRALYRAGTAEDRAGSDCGTRCVMSCSPFDLKDYFLEELADPQQRQVEAHVKACPPAGKNWTGCA